MEIIKERDAALLGYNECRATIEDARIALKAHAHEGLLLSALRIQEELVSERALADRLAGALTDCMGDSEELLGERSWWKDEPRKSYQEDYNKTVTNYKRADFVIQQWKEARSECR